MKIFLKTLFFIMLPVLVVFIASYAIMKSDMDSSFDYYLKVETKAKFKMIEHDFNKKTIDARSLYKIYAPVYKKTMLRITLIKKDGKVIFDSSIPFDKIKMLENHKYRPEVQKALKTGSGFSKRFSKTKQMYMSYFAKVMKNGNILRISYPLTYINSLQNRFESGMYKVFSITIIILILISILVARRLSFPIQKLDYIVDAIKKGKNIHFPRFRDKNLSNVAALIYDIYKAMKEKQREIAVEREKLNHILEFMEEGVLLLDENLSYIHSNAKFEKMFGIASKIGENMLSTVTDIEIIKAFNEILKTKKPYNTIKIKKRSYNVYFKNIEQYLLFVFEDIDEKTQYEYFKSELVGNISHELKTPLAAIMGYTETLMINDDLDKDTRDNFTKKIYESTVRLNELLSDIIELHRLENFNINTINETLNLNELKIELKDIYKSSKKNVYFEFKVDKLKILKEHLLSIITNLIDNAVKYSNGQNIYVKIESQAKKTLIVVDDEGPKIPEGEKDRIFERFYTCSKSRNKEKSGTGLGLSIVKHIAALYNGYVYLKDNEYGGNRFVVEIV